jgi:hypothetical protein
MQQLLPLLMRLLLLLAGTATALPTSPNDLEPLSGLSQSGNRFEGVRGAAQTSAAAQELLVQVREQW